MKLLHVVPSYLPATRYGGPIYSVHGLCQGLARRGHQVEVYTTNIDGPGVSPVLLDEPVDKDGVAVTYFATGLGRRIYRSPDMATALCRHARTFDVIHLHSVFLWPTSAGAAEARCARVPYVLSPRGMLVPELIRRKSPLIKRAWITLFERRNLTSAASVHVTSEIEAADLARLGFEPARVDVIPNGIELPRGIVHHTNRDIAGTQPMPLVLSLGRINWKKGLDRLIEAMAYAPDAKLVIAGNDEDTYTPKLLALAKLTGVAARIRFLGPVHGDEKWSTFASADVFALPSYSENFGISVLEAMACGIPVVVTPEVGLATTVAQTGAGIVADGDPIKFGRAIAHLLANPDLRQRMGEAGRKAAMDQFSWASVSERMEVLYQKLRLRPEAAGA